METHVHQWSDLPRSARAGLISVGVVDAALRVSCLIDLARRPAGRVRGPKPVWALLLGVVNSATVIPALYLSVGRRR